MKIMSRVEVYVLESAEIGRNSPLAFCRDTVVSVAD